MYVETRLKKNLVDRWQTKKNKGENEQMGTQAVVSTAKSITTLNVCVSFYSTTWEGSDIRLDHL